VKPPRYARVVSSFRAAAETKAEGSPPTRVEGRAPLDGEASLDARRGSARRLDGISGGSGLVGKSLATIHAVNRCYVGVAGGVDADVVVDPAEARLATVERADEGARPSGARRVGVWLRGGEAVSARGLGPTAGGFLAGAAGAPAASDAAAAPEPVHVVAVVGLAHANPILERCAERGLRSARERGEMDGEVARAIGEREKAARLANLPWREYDEASKRR